MVYAAIDPSYSRTGLCILHNDTFTFVPISPEGKNQSYSDEITRARIIATEVYSRLSFCKIYDLACDKQQDKATVVKLLIEEPMISSFKASSLGVLSGVLIASIIDTELVNEIYTVNPNTIRQLNSAVSNKEKVTKKQLSLKVANEILEYLQSLGFKVVLEKSEKRKRKLSHDEAEAFLLLLLLLNHEQYFSKEIWTKIVSIHKGYNKNVKINKLKIEMQEVA